MDVQEQVRALIEPALSDRAIELFEVEVVGSGRARVLRISVDRDGGVDLDTIAEVSHLVSPVLDEHDPMRGPYTLEVSSPGVERPLRTPGHFRRVVGELVSVKTHEDVDGERRHRGVLREVGEDGIVVEVDGRERRIDYPQIAAARTVLEWGPAPKPGSKTKTKTKV